MKLSIFYLVYACFLAIMWSIGYNQSLWLSFLHHIFSCMMIGNFATEIRSKRRAKKIAEALQKAVKRAQLFTKVDEDFKNKIKNN